MVMKTTTKTKNSKGFVKKFWWVFPVLFLFVSSIGYIAYNKYLDQQNINNMEQLLSDFEQLKSDIEAETGEKFYIEANCGSVGKFSTSYSCSIDLKAFNKDLTSEFTQYIKLGTFTVYGSCGFASNIYSVDNNFQEYFTCTSLNVRPSNQQKAEEIFYNYDTSPNSPL
jgi:hypothetical protein